MDVLYLSPEFPPNFQHFLVELHRLGARVWALGEAQFSDLPEEVRGSLAWYLRCNLHDPNEVRRAADHLLREVLLPNGHGGFDLVESHNENWMRLEALLNEHLGIAGITSADLPFLKKKSGMKQRFRELGLRVAEGGLVRTFEEGRALAQRLGYPLLLKPDEGVGAQNTFRVDDEAELGRAFALGGGDRVLEQFINAPMVTYDGLTGADGEVVFESSLVYRDGVLEILGGLDTFFHVRREIPEPLRQIGKALVKCFGIRRKFFHFEMFVKDGDYIPVEINARPPGGAILDMMNYSVDGDLYRGWARLVTGHPLDVPGVKRHAVAYLGRNERHYRWDHDAVVTRLGPRLVDFTENPPLFWQGMGRYRYLFRGDDEAELVALGEALMERAHAD